jgi:putative SOS response-associated peptidase YedK
MLPVAPSQIVETIISVNGEKRLGPMHWGFVPATAKEPKLAPINGRAETLPTSPMFWDAFFISFHTRQGHAAGACRGHRRLGEAF